VSPVILGAAAVAMLGIVAALGLTFMPRARSGVAAPAPAAIVAPPPQPAPAPAPLVAAPAGNTPPEAPWVPRRPLRRPPARARTEPDAGTRNTPSAMNLSSRSAFFHDGRAKTLAEQAAGPIENPVEMNLSLSEAVKRLRATQYYQAAFRAAFRKNPNREHLLEALAAYVSTLETGSSPWDAFAKGDEHAVSESAKRGRELFTGKAKCFDCHSGIDFTNDEFRNIGLYDGRIWNDEGRSAVTKLERDKGRFKVPGLRNVALTAPYMHNGGLPNLRAVLDHYNDPNRLVPQAIGRDSLVHPLGLTAGEIDDLEAFLNCLTDTTLLNGAKKWKPSASIDIFAPNNHNHGKR
jgi:cytochrome c peroxidase